MRRLVVPPRPFYCGMLLLMLDFHIVLIYCPLSVTKLSDRSKLREKGLIIQDMAHHGREVKAANFIFIIRKQRAVQ